MPPQKELRPKALAKGLPSVSSSVSRRLAGCSQGLYVEVPGASILSAVLFSSTTAASVVYHLSVTSFPNSDRECQAEGTPCQSARGDRVLLPGDGGGIRTPKSPGARRFPWVGVGLDTQNSGGLQTPRKGGE